MVAELAVVYLESRKDVWRIVVEPEQHGADHVADGEVGEKAMMDRARSSHEAERGERDTVEQQTADGQSRVRHETRAEVHWQSAAVSAGSCWRPIQIGHRRSDTDVDS